MAKIFKAKERVFGENPGRIDDFRLFTDTSISGSGLTTQNLNFDVRRLDPDQYSSTYHFHRNSEELFMIISGSATLRTPEGLQTVESGDVVFFEMGPSGAHQLYNHTGQPCTYLDVRTFTGADVCEYPDSDKLLLVPSMEIFKKNSGLGYFDGEEGIRERWAQLEDKSDK